MTVIDAGTDGQLLDALAHGDPDAFAELVRRYHPQLVRFAMSYVTHRELAEDVAQETWVAALRGLDRFEGRSAFRTWLFGICANRARTVALHERRSVPVAPGDLADGLTDGLTDAESDFRRDGSWRTPPAPWTASADELRDDASMVRRVRGAIDRLPERQRQVLTLRDVAGLSAEEACRVLEITGANQRVLLHRARAGVRRILAGDAP